MSGIQTGMSVAAKGGKPCLGHADRRASPRYDVLSWHLVYVNLGRDNGGIIINCSEGGIAIQTVAPLMQHPGYEFPVYLPNVPRPVLATGDIVWVNELHQAGIRFTATPPWRTWSVFAEWLNETAQTHLARPDLTSPPTDTVAPELQSISDTLVPQLPESSLGFPHAPAEHSIAPQDVHEIPAKEEKEEEEDSEIWGAAFNAAAVLSLLLTLLCSSLVHRATSLPVSPARQMRGAVPEKQDQHSVPIPAPAAVQGSTITPPRRLQSASPPSPHPTERRIRSHLRHLRRGELSDEDEEVIVRHFARPAPSPAAPEQPPR